MDLNINGIVVSLESAGTSKAGKEILQANRVKLQDGTELYIKAYRPGTEVAVKAKAPKVVKAAEKAAPSLDMGAIAEMIAAAVAKATAVPSVAVVPSKK